MGALDWIICLGFLAYSIWDCVRRTQNTRNLEGYFAGRRSIPWWAAGLSVMAAQISAITVLGTTGQGHDGGMEFVQFYLALPLAMVLLSIFFVPFYRAQSILTAYEYLERRFGPATRTLASFIFLVSRGLALGVTLSAPAVILSAICGVPPRPMILLIGILTTIYTYFGGVTAVVWMDVKQMTVIVVGLLVVAGQLAFEVLPDLGLGGCLRAMGAAGKLNAVEPLPAGGLWPRTLAEFAGNQGTRSVWEDQYNLFSCLLGGLFLFLSYFGCDHSQVQRILTNKTVHESRKTLLLSAFVKVPMQVLVLGIGVLMFAFFALHKPPILFNPVDRAIAAQPAHAAAMAQLEREHTLAFERRQELTRQIAAGPSETAPDPLLLAEYRATLARAKALREQALREVHGRTGQGDTNFIFTHFILTYMPTVLLGLVVAAIFAAALSSSDSVLNSLAAAAVIDFYQRWWRPGANDAEAMRVSRVVTVLGGLFATAVGVYSFGQESLIVQVNRLGSFFYGSLLGVFVLALLWKRAGPRAGFVGLLTGSLSVFLVHWTLKVEFLWYNVIGCLGVLVAGAVTSCFERKAPAGAAP